ncbi:phosphoribosyltransferase [Streptomyces sp. NPDC050560]|uniref:phosphoribosyltransferase n=1 Tax=Streptomyces sp. NPDC050560 TaxID=3365630 RepID=UPI0037AB1962
MSTKEWPGGWVARRLGIELADAPGGEGRMAPLLGLALRRNPKRAHLLVSNVLGKHVPQDPAVVIGHGRRLGERVRELLGEEDTARAVVLGYAETATALGQCVADGMEHARCLHSTRRPVPGARGAGGFEESHSHASSHLLLPEDAALLAGGGPLVLVDDELSTGQTVLNTIAALHRGNPRPRYVVAALVDTRPAADRERLARFAADHAIRIDLVTTAEGTVRLPDGILTAGRDLVAAQGPPAQTAATEAPRAAPAVVDLGWPAGLPDGGRHGFTPEHRDALDAALPGMARRVADALALPPGGDGPRTSVLVLGFEELMYAPLRLADALRAPLAASGTDVRFSTTTRSPVLAVDDPGYAIRTALAFPAHDDPADGPGERYAYNVAGGGFDAVVVVVDSVADTPALHGPCGLLAKVAQHTPRVVLAVVPSYLPGARAVRPGVSALPAPLRAPAFSTYPAQDVGWLLRDLSDVDLEAPTEEREEAIQSGGAHYAESLPHEYQPSEEYQRLFETALRASAPRVARAAGTLTELVLAERTRTPVLVSLARAGTPVGVLMRRWAGELHGLDVPHYAVSIVRGRGIDANALRWLTAHHRPEDLVFVDGWTGKGAITRELADACAGFERSDRIALDPGVAVLADPGSCVSLYGTRDDFLVPSACLNSTVSGLVSRTVLRPDLTGPGDYHGAKFYRELLGSDVSRHFVDTVAGHFGAAAGPARSGAEALRTGDRAPTWAGWAAVERISEEYGIHNVNLVKPGVGETTRVLLRRVPWRVLARRGAGADLDHVRLLAEQRGVPVEETDDLPYTCVGLIHPRYTRAATGADGKAVAGA